MGRRIAWSWFRSGFRLTLVFARRAMGAELVADASKPIGADFQKGRDRTPAKTPHASYPHSILVQLLVDGALLVGASDTRLCGTRQPTPSAEFFSRRSVSHIELCLSQGRITRIKEGNRCAEGALSNGWQLIQLSHLSQNSIDNGLIFWVLESLRFALDRWHLVLRGESLL